MRRAQGDGAGRVGRLIGGRLGEGPVGGKRSLQRAGTGARAPMRDAAADHLEPGRPAQPFIFARGWAER